jgi:alpha/beta superfamily hydrolase
MTAVRVRSEQFALTAMYVAGTREDVGAVIAPPHPVYGGTAENPVVVAIREGLAQLGAASLCFNFRGTDGSEGVASSSLDAAVADYQASLEELATRVPGPYIAAGYSFGACTALLAARDDARVQGMVLLAPPLGMLRADDLRAFTGDVLIVCGDDDEYSPLAALKARVAEAARARCTLEVIAGADHFFHFGGLSAIGAQVANHVRGWPLFSSSAC